MATSYQSFLADKIKLADGDGFAPVWMPDFLYDFQITLTDWALRQGRAAIFADCGLGKTPMQLVWAENIRRKTGKKILILSPLAVAFQTAIEGEKFGIECEVSRDGKHKGGIVITNYEQLHHFDPSDFAGVVCDESSTIKNFAGKRRKMITEFMRTRPYRLLCTATAAPNDYHELGTSSEALGYMGFQDMLTRYFKEDTIKDYLGWGRKAYRFRGHAVEPFWRWVCSWAMACRRPSDIGGDDARFVLPDLIEQEHLVDCNTPREGMLFDMPATTLPEQRAELRATMPNRCERIAELRAGHPGAYVVWCHLNDEANLIEKIIPDAVQVSGSMSVEKKEERLLAFQSGEINTLVTKPKIGCFGLNWQHCNGVGCFPSHSFEQYYQAVRRCWRFGQDKPVKVSIVSTEGGERVLKNLQRKSANADAMFDSLIAYMNRGQSVSSKLALNQKEEVPEWL